MTRRSVPNLKNQTATRLNRLVTARRPRRKGTPMGRRARGVERPGASFAPPEDWYEPSESPPSDYRIVVQEPGRGYRHIVTPSDIRERLAQLPPRMLEPLEVVQLSRMTRKKATCPCYGMQWGATLYLYPVEINLIEHFTRPPTPAQRVEAKMFGARWQCEGQQWTLRWSESAIRDFYLNNVLIHELGHLLDQRNSSYLDRERYAEWFAVQHGYKPTRRHELAERAARRVTRRHHGV